MKKIITLLAVTAAVSGAAGCSDDTEPADEESYVVVDEQETGLGTEAVVSVETNDDPEAVFNEVLDDHDYATVTIVCAGEDVREEGYILYGTSDGDTREVVGGEQDRECSE
jgi:hypothetical protein